MVRRTAGAESVINLVAGLPSDPEFGAQRRHRLALEQAGDKPEPSSVT